MHYAIRMGRGYLRFTSYGPRRCTRDQATRFDRHTAEQFAWRLHDDTAVVVAIRFSVLASSN